MIYEASEPTVCSAATYHLFFQSVRVVGINFSWNWLFDTSTSVFVVMQFRETRIYQCSPLGPHS